MRRALIISYYWPPAGGGGVQRWLKFAKYLPEFGYQPVIFIPENADYPVLDETLSGEVHPSTEVIRLPIWEPYRTFRKVSAKGDKSVSAGFIRSARKETPITRVAQWLRGNLIIPDARRFWIGPSVRYLCQYLSEHTTDVIISTGPPHSMHLIAEAVSRRTGIPWLADFRDPWVNMDNADKFRMTRYARARHEFLERRVLRSADSVVTVSWYLSSQYERIRQRAVCTITNGYDQTDFDGRGRPADSGKFIIGHYGTFGEDRNPVALWEALEQLLAEEPALARDLEIQLVGPTDASVLASASTHRLAGCIRHVPYLSHDTIIDRMRSSAVLLVILNQNTNEEGRVTGKIFEYVASRRPVLGIGSVTSDCARVIRETGCGVMVPFLDKAKIRAFILDVYYGRFVMGTADSTRQFSRRELTRQLSEELDRLVEGNIR
ncbi:MAG: glycosyltransferase family 4 protein [Flavobacteriales bacterium]|jgi:glycosyltransferase involved in cell wall biosynthesis